KPNDKEDLVYKRTCDLVQQLRETRPRAPVVSTNDQVLVEVGKMPTSGEHLIGRKSELGDLLAAWNSNRTRVYVLDAMGGAGKTALINKCLEEMRGESWRGAERVYCWSFYSQGTDEKRQGDADGFFEHALEWFGYEGEPIKDAYRRGRELARLV